MTSGSFATSGGFAVIVNGGSREKDKKPTAFKPVGWSGTWYNPDLKPKKLENNDRTTLLCQGRC